MSLELAITENTEVMRQLIAVMQNVGSTGVFTPNEKPVHKTVEVTEVTIAVESDKKPDIEALDRAKIIALALLYGENATDLTTEKLAAVDEFVTAESGSELSDKSDALYMALAGVEPSKHLLKPVLLNLCIQMFKHWDAIPDIASRRAYADLLLRTPQDERSSVKPKVKKADKVNKEIKEDKPPVADTSLTTTEEDPKAIFDTASSLILKLAKGGYRSEAVEILATFGATKLGQVPADKLPEVITLAEKALEG
ncbi:hypothetical protein I2494_19540 [Budviciaceae bacterium BWR-B9]|uniref:Uncharacterized protein n=1 Tax=Limnobaculum allomyrinae TaxID=2791986 RepID=A0ABS1IVT3_9GAMM|nr:MULTISPECIES: hypothetical protein [Limnobaculum]MBK5145865.1 hypothetical protein [Limnobaculum allomyrinae]MBV7693876.1 hypothetical protein [Limnobaculum sp. M2-1]